MNPQNVAIDEYDTTLLASDFGGDEAYKIGVSIEGKPVFVDPDAAFDQVLRITKRGLKRFKRSIIYFRLRS